ncbi:MAG: hypothetical protein Q9188_002523 [Gyalolechia gomerana]
MTGMFTAIKRGDFKSTQAYPPLNFTSAGKPPHRQSSKSTTSSGAPSRQSKRRAQPSSTPSDSLLPRSKPSIEVQIPWVPPYIPHLSTPVLPYPRPTAPGRVQDRCDGSILSRYTKADGTIGFTVNIGPRLGKETGGEEEIDIDLARIYEYVTPGELERYENHDWELEDERERNRPKLGRPRKVQKPPVDILDLNGTHKPMRPPGRPRKRPVKRLPEANETTASAFVGVHVPSPVKPGEATSTYSSSASLPSASKVSCQREPTTSSMEDVFPSHTRDSDVQVDQLTPSNANRVVGAKVPEPSPSRRHKASYSMVQAALGDSESSDDGEVLPDFGSEDELTLVPTTQKRRFPMGAEATNSIPHKEPGHESLFLTPFGSVDAQSQHSHEDRAASADDQSLSEGSIGSPSNDVTDLLEQFQASKTRRVRSNSPNGFSSNAQRSKTVDVYIKPRNPTKASAIPANPQHQPAVPSESQSLQLGLIHGYKRVVSNTFRQRRAVHLPPTPSEPYEHRTAGLAPPLSANFAPEAKPADLSQAVRKRQGQLPRGSVNPGPTPTAAPDSQKKSTPPSSRKNRHSMTPHFPPSKRSHQEPMSTSLRGGITHSFSANTTPRHQRRARLTSSSPPKTISRNHHEVQPLLNRHPNSTTTAGDIILGDLEMLSEENHHRPRLAESASRRSSPPGFRVDQEIILGELETSSEEDDHRAPLEESLDHRSSDVRTASHSRVDQEIILGSPILSTSSEDALRPDPTKPVKHDRPSGTSYTKKRRRSSSESEEGGGSRSWYRMVRR